MRAKVQRGRILHLTAAGHKRIIPDELPHKIGKRPFLVVQRDYTNNESDYTVVVGLTTASAKDEGRSRPKNKNSIDVLMPKGIGLANQMSVADCGSLYTIHENEVHNVFDGVYPESVMKEVNAAILLALDLDPDGILRD